MPETTSTNIANLTASNRGPANLESLAVSVVDSAGNAVNPFSPGALHVLQSVTGQATASGNTTLIAADATKKIKVYALSLTTNVATAVTVKIQSGAGGTDLWRVIFQAPTNVNVGANLVVTPPAWLFSTAAATLLNINLSAAVAVDWSLAYFVEA